MFTWQPALMVQVAPVFVWMTRRVLEGLMLLGRLLSSLLSLAYLMEIPLKGFFYPPDEPPHHEGVHEAPTPSLIAIVATAVACLILFVYPEPFYELMTLVVAP